MVAQIKKINGKLYYIVSIFVSLVLSFFTFFQEKIFDNEIADNEGDAFFGHSVVYAHNQTRPVPYTQIDPYNRGNPTSGGNHNQNHYEIPRNNTIRIDEWGACRNVTNNNSETLFVPTKTPQEWLEFLENVPNGVTVLNNCTRTIRTSRLVSVAHTHSNCCGNPRRRGGGGRPGGGDDGFDGSCGAGSHGGDAGGCGGGGGGGGGCAGTCIGADVQLTTDLGDFSARSIRPGDNLKSPTGNNKITRVLIHDGIHSSFTPIYTKFFLEDGSDIVLDGHTIAASFDGINFEWHLSCDLEKGMYLLNKDYKSVMIYKIEKIKSADDYYMYNFSTDALSKGSFGTYWANGFLAGDTVSLFFLRDQMEDEHYYKKLMKNFDFKNNKKFHNLFTPSFRKSNIRV